MATPKCSNCKHIRSSVLVEKLICQKARKYIAINIKTRPRWYPLRKEE
jgi:hypothetical protein